MFSKLFIMRFRINKTLSVPTFGPLCTIPSAWCRRITLSYDIDAPKLTRIPVYYFRFYWPSNLILFTERISNLRNSRIFFDILNYNSTYVNQNLHRFTLVLTHPRSQSLSLYSHLSLARAHLGYDHSVFGSHWRW